MARRLVLVNSAWLIGDKVVRIGVGLLFWVWFARHFGPEQFGVWNYAIAFTALFGTFATLGLEGVVVRHLTSTRDDAGTIIGTALLLRLAAGTLAGLAAMLVAACLRPGDGLALTLVGCNALALVFQSSQVFDCHFQARMHTRPAVLAVNVA